MDHINVKIFAKGSFQSRDAINVFHRWIQDQAEPALIDVADYSHVPFGPGVMLIGHDGFFSLDERDGRLGLLYNQRTEIAGTTQEKIRHSYNSALRACRRLEQEPEFEGKLQFDDREFEVLINDRLIAPNEEATWLALEPDLASAFPNAKLQWNGASRELFRVSVLGV